MSGLRAAARHAPSRHAAPGPGRQIRPQLVRAAVLPTLAAGLSGTAAVIFTLQLGGGAGHRDGRLWPVLAGCALLAVGALAAALLGAQRGAKAVRDRCEALRRSSLRGRQELRTTAERLERGERAGRQVRAGRAAAPPEAGGSGVDEFWLLAQELRTAREHAHDTLVRMAAPPPPSDSDRKVQVFVNLARRLQSLVHREISLLDELEDTVEDPDLLKELFHVDHLATRIRRHAENLAVLGGAASRRQWTRPIDLSEVLRSSVAEVEQYTRVKVVPPAGGTVRGHAVADVVHLLAELVENATVFSAPDTDVVVRAERVTAGIAVEVEDRGLGLPPQEQNRMNALLGDPDQVSVGHLLADGRIGLYVVSVLARRHGIAVELKPNIYGGVLAVLVLPQELLGAQAPGAAEGLGGSRPTSWGMAETAPPPEPDRRTPLDLGLVPASPEGIPSPAGTAEAGGPAWAHGTRPEPGLAPRTPLPRRVPAARTSRETPPTPTPTTPPTPADHPAPAAHPASATRPGPAASGAHPGSPAPAASAAWPSPAAPVTHPGPASQAAPAGSATRPGTVAFADHPAPASPAAPAARPGPVGPADPVGHLDPAVPAAPADRPRLPRRRAQTHLAPELREAPVGRPADEGGEQPLHDPGLMAAFQRGFGLAQSAEQQS
ncbi:ATP-binding protein [Streptomyces sp. NPDC001674]|uniref:sensor histidine kinase n=1 Tax=Streptomyces sp. NPDC001674 TaxID=3154394 RepID=UPI00332A2A0B